MGEPLLVAKGLVRRFGGAAAVDGASLSVAAGEFHAIIGPNGAGKTTLFNLLTGNLRVHAGMIQFDGRDVTGLPPHRLARLGMGRTFQINNIFLNNTVRENIQLAGIAHHRRTWNMLAPARDLFIDEAEAIARRVGLEDRLDTPGAWLPYGDRRRLELAITLACRPRLLLLDEPTCGMSSHERPALIRLIREVVSAQNVAVILIEHDMDIVFSTAERITVMHRGRVIADDRASAIVVHPEVRRVYLGSTGHA